MKEIINEKELILKKLDYSHIPLFNKWWNDEEIGFLTSGHFNPLSQEDVDRKWQEKLSDPARNDFIIYFDKKPIGHILIWKPKRKKNFEIYIALGEKDYWGKGLGTLAMQKISKWFFRNFPLENQIDLEVNFDNTRAINCYKKAGFSIIRKKHYKNNPDTYLMRKIK